ncbi:hypothetical protein D9757_015386 [Collybiopsis confluens]|uniref:Ubiquitin-like protease family profile domain-containing protein n=1 Tax=Collybiopsis confluens TaxID=2823264 RepID=A0A8H5CEB0_9AGAR|nr:hypothetical protein D9757_015386 [Collybiopsis confluens]
MPSIILCSINIFKHYFPTDVMAIFYADFEALSKRLGDVSCLLAAVPGIQKKFVACSRRHSRSLSSESKALVAFRNLGLLGDCVTAKQIFLENYYSRALDDHPQWTEEMLRNLMHEARNSPQYRWDNLPEITFSHFSTLGVAQWVNGELINYFVNKWCHGGTTLGLNSYFACKHLFQKNDCINAKSGTLTLEDQSGVLRWCEKAMRKLSLSPNWDTVFIPIHEGASHWYSAMINFSLKRIEIYDSLWNVCMDNRPRPLPLRKNTSLMLVLMWLTEVLGHMRGDPVRLSNNPATDWTFDSHSEFRDGLLLPDRLAHLNLTQDRTHRRHVRRENKVVDRRFTEALETAAQAKRHGSRRYKRKPEPKCMDVEVGLDEHLSSSYQMDIEHVSFHDLDFGDSSEDRLLDEPGSLVEVDELGNQEQMDDALSEQMSDERNSEREESGDFHFLPDPTKDGMLEDNNDPKSGIPTYRPMNHSLVEDDTPDTCVWHSTAGGVFGYQRNVYERWQKILSKKGTDVDKNYEPFASRLEWEMARWAVMEKVSQRSFDRLLQIPHFKENLGVKISSVQSMLKKVDKIPDRCGPWYTKRLSFKDRPEEYFLVRHRNPINAIKALWGDPAFINDLVYKPAKLFRAGSAQTEENRIYNEMWTAGLWNAAQHLIPRGGTVAPVIIASDKTQLTQFSGSKSAYPVYITIGNIPKALRRKPGSRTCILIAYLFADKLDKVGLTETSLKLRNYELFHRSMSIVLEPLKAAGDPTGLGTEMVGGDGAVRRVYPLLATYIADYPEQCLISCTKYGTCPKCQCTAQQLDLTVTGPPRTQEWTYRVIQNARDELQGRGRAIHARTMESDVAGGDYEPFWVGFPLADIHQAIAPDVLHQLYQGVFKHLVEWVQKTVGEKEFDERIRVLPPTDGVRHFTKGISGLAQMSGAEHKHIARSLLACLVGKMDNLGINACRGILHFIQLAQYPSHDGDTLQYMKEALDTWHRYRDYFITAGARTHFKIPKFHSLLHYAHSIRWLGTTDNYNTEAFERLHVDTAKEGWRSSNKRDHFPQMVQFLSRQEKVTSFDFYQSWNASNEPQGNHTCGSEEFGDDTSLDHKGDLDEEYIVTGLTKSRLNQEVESIVLHLAKRPHEPRKYLSHIVVSHCAPGFILQLKLFLRSFLPHSQLGSKSNALQSPLPFTAVEVWHHFKLTPLRVLDETERAIVRATPTSRTTSHSRFDTVIVLDGEDAESTAVAGKGSYSLLGVDVDIESGCRAARLRVIFRLPRVVKRHGFPIPAPSDWPTGPLAYVTWFTRFEGTPNEATGMYRVEPSHASNGIALGAIIPLSDIRQHCMLVPSRREWEKSWTSYNILDQCSSFFPRDIDIAAVRQVLQNLAYWSKEERTGRNVILRLVCYTVRNMKDIQLSVSFLV